MVVRADIDKQAIAMSLDTDSERLPSTPTNLPQKLAPKQVLDAPTLPSLMRAAAPQALKNSQCCIEGGQIIGDAPTGAIKGITSFQQCVAHGGENASVAEGE